jgi:hypothetical protein
VRVVGSRTGVHAGVVRPYSTGTGASFLPSRPFAAGERVAVRASVTTAGTSGRASTTFTIARQAVVSQKEFPLNAGNPREVQHHATAPSFTPSTVRLTTPARPGASPGYLFLAPYQGDGTAGPMIADQRGELVWFRPLPAGEQAANFHVQQLDGKPVLTWWEGRIIQAGFGEGQDLVYDDSYRRIATIKAGNGYRADLHQLGLTSQGTAWIDAFDPIHADLRSVHGAADAVLSDSVVQEVDVRTGLVMWEWHALGHIPITESKNPVPHNYPWDYAHLNSAEPGADGDVLVSVRNTSTLYDLDLRSGGVRWRLGGARSSFALGPGTRFFWQHDAEFQPRGLISVFDNGSDPPMEKQSRGLLLQPDGATHTVTLTRQFTNPAHTLLAESQGNMLSLPGGNWLLGYGRLPNFTEFDSGGHLLLDGTLGRSVQNYSTFISPRSGHPATRPSLLVRAAGAGTVSETASWNGATEVASWRVLAGAGSATLAPLATAAKTGFETTLAVRTAGPYVAVQALDGAGGVLATSATAKA